MPAQPSASRESRWRTEEFTELNAKFDLSFLLTEEFDADGGQAGLLATLEYATDLFDPATAERIANAYVRALDALTASPRQHISELETGGPRMGGGPRRSGPGPELSSLAGRVRTCP